MTVPYETEVRVRVPRIEEMRARLEAVGARRIEAYAFTDEYTLEGSSAWSSAEIVRRDMAALAEADLVVAEVTVPSLGVGMELAVGRARGLPVVALVEAGTTLSALVEGDDRIRLIRYGSEDQAVQLLLQATAAFTA